MTITPSTTSTTVMSVVMASPMAATTRFVEVFEKIDPQSLYLRLWLRSLTASGARAVAGMMVREAFGYSASLVMA